MANKVSIKKLCTACEEFKPDAKERCKRVANLKPCPHLHITPLPVKRRVPWEDSRLCLIVSGRRAKTATRNEDICKRCELRHTKVVLGREMKVCSLSKGASGRRYLPI